jgi:hypothetical protein
VKEMKAKLDASRPDFDCLVVLKDDWEKIEAETGPAKIATPADMLFGIPVYIVETDSERWTKIVELEIRGKRPRTVNRQWGDIR